MRMTDKQARFCEEYMVDLNATQAAIRAGYSPASAKTVGPRLLENVGVQKFIAQLQAEQSRRTGVSTDRVVRELAKLHSSTPLTSSTPRPPLSNPMPATMTLPLCSQSRSRRSARMGLSRK